MVSWEARKRSGGGKREAKKREMGKREREKERERERSREREREREREGMDGWMDGCSEIKTSEL